jgi:uncharacterized membrane protein YqjE
VVTVVHEAFLLVALVALVVVVMEPQALLVEQAQQDKVTQAVLVAALGVLVVVVRVRLVAMQALVAHQVLEALV